MVQHFVFNRQFTNLRSLLFFFLALLCCSLHAQVNIQGQIVDDQNAPIEFAYVSLFSADSTFLVGDISDIEGKFAIDLKDYLVSYLEINMLGFVPKSISLSATNNPDFTIGTILLQTNENTLEEVQITAKRAFIERKLDKLIVNVSNSIVDAGQSAYDALEKSPGVFVDPSGSISLKGKSGVRIMIDDKPVQLSEEALISYLKSVHADQIDLLEIISNPSAKYEAEGISGIINIVMKRNTNLGTNGSVSISYGRSQHNRFSTGINLNNRTEKLNVFGSYSFGINRRQNNLIVFRKFSNQGNVVSINDQNTLLTFPIYNHNVRFGIDLYSTPKTTFGILATGHFRNFKPKGDGLTKILSPTEELMASFNTSNRSLDDWSNYSLNGNMVHRFDKKGQKLNVDIDYAHFQNTTEQLFNTNFFDPDNNPINEEILFGDIAGGLDLYAAKIDFETPLTENLKLETGLKTSYVENDNNLKYYDRINNVDILDIGASNHFLYDENINAAYATLSTKKGKWDFQGGLRLEQTIAHGNQITTDTTFDRNYIQLFPSFFTNYTITPDHVFGINLSRRLNRPSYRQLNPFRAFVDKTTYREGNPFLKPQVSYNSELSYTYKQRYTATISYSRTTDEITTVLLQNDEEQVTILKYLNIGEYNYFGLGINGSFSPTKSWTSRFDLNGFYNEYIGQVSNEKLDVKDWSYSISSNNTIRLPKNWSFEINGYYQPKFTYGISEIEPVWHIGAGVQKTLFDNKATIRLNANDIFWTHYPSGFTDFGNINESFQSIRDTRVVTLSFNYKFGNNKIAPSRRRRGGAEEEKRRSS